MTSYSNDVLLTAARRGDVMCPLFYAFLKDIILKCMGDRVLR